ncbi:MAG: CPBP family intramembrane metalloprotease [Oscillospiraceae bacterium]|nr:CPBP family intramembrane metalloprotease [Oscillospiraceae bacterium]
MDFNNQYNIPPTQQMPPPQFFYPPADYVSPEEKKKIRHEYNVIGIVLLSLLVLMNVICQGSFIILMLMGQETVYDENGYVVNNLWNIIIGGCFPALIAMIVFAGYCLFTKYDPREIFSVKNVKAGETVRYALIVLFFQQVSLICTIFIGSGLDYIGLYVPGVDYVLEHDPMVYVSEFLGAVFLAPIGEELIYRGIVLRCSAKISQRFAIFFSAFIFGIMHGNPYQFVLGFLLGIPLAMVTLKTGSIVPAIICHMTNNLMASVSEVVGYFNEEISYVIPFIMLVIFFIIGIIVLISAAVNGRIKFPAYTSYHKSRTMPILITSWSVIVVTVLYFIELVISIQPISA